MERTSSFYRGEQMRCLYEPWSIPKGLTPKFQIFQKVDFDIINILYEDDRSNDLIESA